MLDAWGPHGSFGDRDCTKVMGSNSYGGARNCNATRTGPGTGRDNVPEVDYWTMDYQNLHALIAMSPWMNLLANEAIKVGKGLFQDHIKLLECCLPLPAMCILASLCVNKIFTFGPLGIILSFACSSHTDKKDKASNEYQEQLRTQLQSRMTQISEKQQGRGISGRKAPLKRDNKTPIALGSRMLRYLTSWLERFGHFDARTSCGYADVGAEHLPQGTVVYQFFNMGGMETNAQLGPGVTHNFFASQFCHNTAMSVGAYPDGTVFLKHDMYCNFAWGASSAPSVATRTRSRRTEDHEVLADDHVDQPYDPNQEQQPERPGRRYDPYAARNVDSEEEDNDVIGPEDLTPH